MKKIKKGIRQILINIGLLDDLTIDEQFIQFIEEQKHTTLIERIKAIRNNSNYEPNYNLPKVFADVKILYQETPLSEFKPISMETRLAYDRPSDYKGDMATWLDAMKTGHKKDLEVKQIQEDQEEQRQEIIDTVFTEYIMKQMMKIN